MIRKPLFIIVFCLACACTKRNNISTQCHTTILGYTSGKASASSSSACIFAIYNATTKSYSPLAACRNGLSGASATYDPNRFNYYVLRTSTASDALVLYRINLSGKIDTLSAPAHGATFQSLVYNKVTRKLYSIKSSGAGFTLRSQIAELTDSGTLFTVKTVAIISRPFVQGEPVDMAVDNVTGIVYCSGINTATETEISKYVPGDSTCSLVFRESATKYMGIQCNSRNHSLYAIRQSGNTWSPRYWLVSIGPAGDTNMVDSIPFSIYPSYFSATFDACSNEYLFTTMKDSANSIMRHISIPGTVRRNDTVTGIWAGLHAEH